MDYALEMTSTRAIALFIETIRNPSGFIAALEKAHARGVPVIVCKVGRTEESAHFAYTHLGAIAGDDAAYDAVFERYGALRAATLDDLMGTALLMSQRRRAGPGGLASVTDSGGLRELLIDMADEIGVPFATIGPDTLAKLRACLPYTLEASNPLDAGAPFSFDYAGIFRESLHALMDDPDTAIGSFEFDGHDDFNPVPAQAELAMSMPGYSEKPFFVVNSFAGARNMALAQDLLAVGVPVLNGTATALKAVRHAFAYRDHRARPAMVPPAPPDDGVLARWRARLSATTVLAETAGLELLRNFGVPVVTTRNATNRESAIAAAEELGYPVALKTSDPAIQHKTEVRGVRLALPDARAVAAAYVEMAHRLGPRVTVAPMVERGVEMSFGFVNDPQFGALVAVGAGGTLLELLGDQVLALAPFDEIEARRLIDRLAVRPLLDGLRGAPAVDLEALAGALARFSVLAAELSDCLSEADVNPVIAGPEGCLAVDALMVGRGEEIVEVRHG